MVTVIESGLYWSGFLGLFLTAAVVVRVTLRLIERVKR